MIVTVVIIFAVVAFGGLLLGQKLKIHSDGKNETETVRQTVAKIEKDDTTKEKSTEEEITANETERVTEETTTEEISQEPETEETTTEEITTEKLTSEQNPTPEVQTQTKEIITEAPTEQETEPYLMDSWTSTTYSDWIYESSGRRSRTVTTTQYYEYSDGRREEFSNSYIETDDSEMTTEAPTQALLSGDMKADAEKIYQQYYDYLQEVLKYTNEARAEVGVAPLVLDETLSKAACHRAAEMDYYDTFSHTRPDGTSCFSVFDEYGIRYGWAGENIASGYPSPRAVVNGWINSPGHYANMINESFTKLGVGYTDHNMWVQMFTS